MAVICSLGQLYVHWPTFSLGCTAQPCHSGATCIIQEGTAQGYKCHCRPGYFGFNCEYYDVCSVENPCLNQGLCRNISSNSYMCICQSGWYDKHCERFNPCTLSPCLFGSECRNVSHNEYECLCRNGYYGKNCDLHNPCAGNEQVCYNGGTCSHIGNEDYRCSCVYGYFGRQCERYNFCVREPCRSGGSCYNTSTDDYRCECLSGYFGKSCEHLNMCSSSPCQHDGICTNYTESFVCSCAPGKCSRLRGFKVNLILPIFADFTSIMCVFCRFSFLFLFQVTMVSTVSRGTYVISPTPA